MVDVVITGIGGRMGAELRRAVGESGTHRIVAGTVRPGAPSQDLASRLAIPVDDTLEAAIGEGANAKVVIDFTSPAASVEHAKICASLGVPLVIGTTGLQPPDHEILVVAARTIPLVVAPNMSPGMNLLFRLAAIAAKELPGYDAEIVEIHHRRKKDAPSGTALRLAERIAAAREGTHVVHGRVGQSDGRPEDEIGMHALRGGDVAGDHTVYLLGDGERIELTHRASSRSAFAAGALRAAAWVVGQTPGLYSMQDVLRDP